MAFLTIIKPGLLTTVQDRGRWGWQSRGVAVSGAMDQASHRLANALVGNMPDAATIEITMLGPELECSDDCLVAATGAEFSLTVNGAEVTMNTAVNVPAGGTVAFGARRRGCRAYMAVSGGLAVTPLFGSRSTHLPSAMGGFEGRALRRGDRLPLGDAVRARRTQGAAPVGSTGVVALDVLSRAPVRVMPGPHSDHFEARVLDVLVSASYLVQPESNRMGLRLVGPRLVHEGVPEIRTEAMPAGALQVPGSGAPILLMADRQTSGGYPVLATVITADLDRVAQLAPGDGLAFELCTRTAALAALAAREHHLASIERRSLA